MPGTPGHAATNVIDQRGGLDPRGMTVDGNNAAGVAKGFKMAESSEGSDAAAWDERLRKLWERRDPDGIEAANPYQRVRQQEEDLMALLGQGTEKAAAVEPLPRWKNPPRKPLNQEMLESPGVQNLLAALGMESTPDGDVRDKHACESSHSHQSQAEALFAASELSQLLKST